MIKKFEKFMVVGFGNIFNAFLGLTFLTAVARSLSVDDFGRYALLSTLLISMARFTDLGSNASYVAKTLTKDQDIRDAFLTLKILLLTIASILSITILTWLGLGTKQVISIFLVGLIAYAINLTLFTFFQKEEKFYSAVGLNTLPSIFKGIFAIMIFLDIFRPNLYIAFLIFSFSMITSTLLLIILPKGYKKFSWDMAGVKELFLDSYPAGIGQLINESWSALANTVTKITKSFTDVGILSIADKISSIFNLISFSIFTVLLPKNAKRKQGKLAYDTKETFTLSFIILVMAAFATIIGNWGIIKLFGDKYAASTQILGLMIFASAFTAIHTFIDNYFYIENKTKAIMYINIGKVFVFITLSLLLIPTYALTGLAFAYLSASILAFLATFTLMLRK